MSSNLILLALLSLFIVAPAHALADALVGTWKIKITPDEDARKAGEKKEIEDKITLKGSKFVSERWKKEHKFEAVEYEEDSRRGPIAKFTAKPTSKTAGKMEWTGIVTSGVIKGEITWTKADGTELKYAFEGEKSQ
ncbi:MAG: hypothetical protein M3478_06630 [Planctomycetota bacterium]|nr:hypothetical protein [Planctomycetota bacterium]